MNHLNDSLFLWINAPAHPSRFLLAFATFWAKYAILVIPAMVGIGWLRGSKLTRLVLIEACVACLIGLFISFSIGAMWPHPRPFMVGLGHTLISHAPDSSFPSDHLTLIWAFSLSLLLYRNLRITAVVLILLGLPMAWARIYVGVHFPLDILGAATVAALSAWLALLTLPFYLPTTYKLAMNLHGMLFGKLITLGWVRK